MARIRTIKPEFWTDETIVRLPFIARLLFIGMWNFADDTGAIEYSPERLRLQVLPAEHECDITALIDLLETSGLINYWASDEGTQAISIRNWNKHQKIDNPSRKTIIKEGYRKKNIPSDERVAAAKKYGCPPGGTASASCFYCGMPGQIQWWNGSNGKPSRWITLSDLEFDHFLSEHDGGENSNKNIVLACRACNRGKREFDPHQFFAIKNPVVALANPSEPSPLDQGREGIKEGIKEGRVSAPGKPDAKTLTTLGVDKQTAKDWLAVRKAKKAPLTETALDDLKREAGKAGITIAEAVSICARRSWQGFNASWNWRDNNAAGNKQTALEERNRRVAEEAAKEFANGNL